MRTRLATDLPNYVAAAALSTGLPGTSVLAFVKALAANDTAALTKIPGITPIIILARFKALQHAFADSLRVVYMIAAPFGAVACIACFFVGDMRPTMNYRVDAPVESLHAKKEGHNSAGTV